MSETHRNTAEKGIITEINSISQPEGSVRDMLNFRIIHTGGDRYKIKTIRGTEYSFSLNPKYRFLGGYDAGNYAIILSTNSRDSNPSNGEIGIVVYSNTNYFYLPLYNHKDLAFRLSKYAQLCLYQGNNKNHQAFWWNNFNPPMVLNVKNPSLYVTYGVADALTLDKEYMVTSGRAEYPPASNVFYGPNEATGTVFTVVIGQLNYADPGTTDPRVIAYSPKWEMLELIPKIGAVNYVLFNKELPGGNLKTGNWYYFTQYEYDGEVRTAWSIGTTGIHITEDPATPLDWGAYHEYQGMGGNTGIPNNPDQNTGKGIQLLISNIDTKYTKIRVAAVRATDFRIIEQPILIAEIDITPATTTVTVDHINQLGIFQLSDIELINYTAGILFNKTGNISKNIAFLGGITTRYQHFWEPYKDASITPITKDLLHDYSSAAFTGAASAPKHPDHTTGPWNIGSDQPLYGHRIQESDVAAGANIYAHQWYQVTGGNIEAPAGTAYSADDVFMYDGTGPLGPLATVVSVSGTPIVKPVIVINLYGGERFVIPFEDWYDQKGMSVNHYMRGGWRNETYRWGILLHDPWGIPYDANWLGDITMPKMSDTIENTTDIDNPIAIPGSLLRTRSWPYLATAGRLVHYIQTLGIRVDDINFNSLIESLNEVNGTSFTLADLPTLFRGFSIVVAPRDSQIVAQGIAYPIYEWNDVILNVQRVSPIGHDAIFTDPAGALPGLPIDGYAAMTRDEPNNYDDIQRVENYYEFLSPDFLMKFNNDMPDLIEGDYIEVVAHLKDPGRIIDHYGTIHTWPFFLYSKFTEFDDNEADGMAPIGATTTIKTSLCRNLTEGDAAIIPVDGTDRAWFNYGLLFDWRGPIVLRMGIGGKKFMLVTDADESGSDPDWINGLSNYLMHPTWSHLSQGPNKCLINIIRPKSTLYGGTSQSSLEATVYKSTGHFQPFDDAFMAHLADTTGGKTAGHSKGTEVFGMDCHISLFDFTRIVQYGDVSDAIGPPIENFGFPSDNSDPTLTGTTDRFELAAKYGHAVIFPVESNINIGLREGRHVSKDRSAGDLDLPLVSNPEGVAFGIGDYDNAEGLRYNEAYSTDFIFALFPAAKKLNFYNNEYPLRYIWSLEADLETQINKLRNFPFDNKKDVDGVYGSLITMKTKASRLFYWQEFGLGYIAVDERAMIPNSLGTAVSLGATETGDRFDQVDDVYGLQHQMAHCEIPDGFSWYDNRRKAWCIMNIGSGMARLEVLKPNQSFIANIIDIQTDSPLTGTGYSMTYNSKLKEILLSIIPGNFSFDVDDPEAVAPYSVGYNTEDQIFTLRTTNAPGIFLNFNNQLFSQSDHIFADMDVAELAISTPYAIGAFATVGDNIYNCIVAHTTAASDPFFIPANWQLVGKRSNVYLNEAGDPSEFYGITKKSHIRFIVNPIKTGDEQFVFDAFEFNGMDENFFRTVRVLNSYQDALDDNIDVNGHEEYQFRDRKWVCNVALESDETRMIDAYMEVMLVGDNRAIINGERSLFENDGKTISLLSLITTFRKAY